MPYTPPPAPDFTSSDPIVALVTFTNSLDTFSLGSDDCWIEVSVLPDKRRRYVIHCFYAARYGAGSYIEGDARAVAESYLATLVEGMGGLCVFTDMKTPFGTTKVPKSEDFTKVGTLENPFTVATYENVFLVEASQQDEGGRAIGFDLAFETAGVGSTASAATVADATYRSVELGNSPALFKTSVGPTQYQVEVQVFYNAALEDRLTYPKTLADALEFSPLLIDEVPRGTTGNRAIIRSFQTEAATLKADKNNDDPLGILYPAGLPATYFEEDDLYLQSLQSVDNGELLELTLTFVKSR
jgi:hypothetical protein